MAPITLYPGGDDPVTPNLKLALKNMSLTTGNNFEIIDAAIGSTPGPFISSNPTATQTVAGTTEELILDNTNSGTGPTLAIGTPLGNPISGGGLMLTARSGGAAELEIHNNFAQGIEVFTHSNTNFRAPTVSLNRSGGTQTTPLGVPQGGQLGYLSFEGYDSSTYAVGSQLWTQIGTAWTPTNHNCTVALFACAAGTTNLNEVFRWNSSTDNNDINGNVSRLSMWVNNINKDTTAIQYLGFISGDGVGNVAQVAFQNPSAGVLLLGNGTAGDISGSLKLGNTTLSTAAPTVAVAQVGLGSTTSATVGAAGGASAPPATPVGYLIINVAGTAVKVPYYNS
jgi:hypothetical protein